MAERRTTSTSPFGSPGREAHDASYFYAGRLYPPDNPGDGMPYGEVPVPPDVLDQIIVASSETMHHLPDACIHLMVTSPPYNARKEYDEDLTLEEYRALLRRVFRETYRVLVPGAPASTSPTWAASPTSP